MSNHEGGGVAAPGAAEGETVPRIALHEAGHAVAAWAVGVRFETVTVYTDRIRLGVRGSLGLTAFHAQESTPERAAIIKLAGAAAVARADGTGWRHELTHPRNRGDIEGACAALGIPIWTVDGRPSVDPYRPGQTQITLAEAWRQAEDVVAANWTLMQQTADKLEVAPLDWAGFVDQLPVSVAASVREAA